MIDLLNKLPVHIARQLALIWLNVAAWAAIGLITYILWGVL